MPNGNPPFANPGVAEKAPLQSLQSCGVYSLLEIPTDSYHFPSHLTPLSDPNSHFARKALSATPGLAPGGLGTRQILGHTPSTAGTILRKFRKDPGHLSELFLQFPLRVRLGSPKPYNSRHLKAPEHFQNSLPHSTAKDASFSRSGSREGLSEPVREFPAVLGVLLKYWAWNTPEDDSAARLLRRSATSKTPR